MCFGLQEESRANAEIRSGWFTITVAAVGQGPPYVAEVFLRRLCFDLSFAANSFIFITGGIGQIVNNGRSHHRFKQADHAQGQSIGENNRQSFKV